MFLEANAVYTARNPDCFPLTLMMETPLSWAWDSVYPAWTIFWDYWRDVSNPMLLSVIGMALVISFGITQKAIFSFLALKVSYILFASFRVPGPPMM